MRKPEQGIAEGQIAVFYAASSDWCLGSATITSDQIPRVGTRFRERDS
jgi:tRNA U34 2-thiouridine synthase MnmA/TrmU